MLGRQNAQLTHRLRQQHAPKNRRGATLSPVRLAGSCQAGLTSYSRWDYWFSFKFKEEDAI
jgi:hypothetical protein